MDPRYLNCDNCVRIVNFAASKNLVVKSTKFPHQNIHKHTWISPDGKTHSQTDHILIDRRLNLVAHTEKGMWAEDFQE
jgi:hypothetical protein